VVPQHDPVGLDKEQHARVERRAPRRRPAQQGDGEDEADQQRWLVAPAHGFREPTEDRLTEIGK